jgi:hypothetical protein
MFAQDNGNLRNHVYHLSHVMSVINIFVKINGSLCTTRVEKLNSHLEYLHLTSKYSFCGYKVSLLFMFTYCKQKLGRCRKKTAYIRNLKIEILVSLHSAAA